MAEEVDDEEDDEDVEAPEEDDVASESVVSPGSMEVIFVLYTLSGAPSSV